MCDPRIAPILQGLGTPEPSQAWGEFLESYSALLFRVVQVFERDPDRASDCFLFVCEHLAARRFRRLRQFRIEGPAKFETWLRAVVRNLCLDWHRQEFGRQRIFQTVAALPALDQAVFRCVYEQDCSLETATACLSSRFSAVTQEQVAESIQRIERTLTSRQRSLLQVRHTRSGRTGEGHTLGEDGLLLQVADTQPNAETTVARREKLAALQRALWHLPGEERLIIFFRFIRELTLEQMARLFRLHGTQGADRRIREVLEHLRRGIEDA